MTLEDLGNIGEFISAIAVLFTLVYLSLQIRQANQTAKEQARTARSERVTQMLLSMSTRDSIYSDAFAKISEQERIMDPITHRFVEKYGFEIAEANRMAMWCFAWLKGAETDFFQPMDTEEKVAHAQSIRVWMEFSFAKTFWNDDSAAWFDKRFVDHVNKIQDGI